MIPAIPKVRAMLRCLSTAMLCLCFLLTSCAITTGPENIRIATINIAMGLQNESDLFDRLQSGDDPGLASAAEIIQTVRPDILLINEFDYKPESVALLNNNYLFKSWSGQSPIEYAHSFIAAVNTGTDSGMDLDGDGQIGGPNDAWGFGTFPGQYGMLVLTRFPVNREEVRSFRHFRWKDLPGALRPFTDDGESYYSDGIWEQLRLSSKSHWDIPIEIGKQSLHFLVSHPTPPVFDGPEDRNGRRNYDEIRLWADYLEPQNSWYLYDDNGRRGGLAEGSLFVIAGDQNSDPSDGDSLLNSIQQLLNHPKINNTCTPSSKGARQATLIQGQANLAHQGDPATDTSDFSDESTGNLRLDYVLPSKNLEVRSCGVYWPSSDETGHGLVKFTDHRLVWVDIEF